MRIADYLRIAALGTLATVVLHFGLLTLLFSSGLTRGAHDPGPAGVIERFYIHQFFRVCMMEVAVAFTLATSFVHRCAGPARTVRRR